MAICDRKNKRAHLFIVGKDPDIRVRELGSDSITVTGTVKSVQPFYLNSSVAVVPIFTGGGVKTKLIEAISYNVPVICTHFGAEGTVFRHNRHIFVADEPISFSEGVLDALSCSKEVFVRKGNAYNTFLKFYTWEGVIKDLNNFLTGIMKK